MSEQLNFYSGRSLPTLLKLLLLLLLMHCSVPNWMHSSQEKEKMWLPCGLRHWNNGFCSGFWDATVSWVFSFLSGCSFSISIHHTICLPRPKFLNATRSFLQLLMPERSLHYPFFSAPGLTLLIVESIFTRIHLWYSDSTKCKSSSQLPPIQTKPQLTFC